MAINLKGVHVAFDNIAKDLGFEQAMERPQCKGVKYRLDQEVKDLYSNYFTFQSDVWLEIKSINSAKFV